MNPLMGSEVPFDILRGREPESMMESLFFVPAEGATQIRVNSGAPITTSDARAWLLRFVRALRGFGGVTAENIAQFRYEPRVVSGKGTFMSDRKSGNCK